MSLEARITESIEGLLDRLDEETDAEDAVRWADAAFKLTDALDTAFGPPADADVTAALARIEAATVEWNR